MSYCRWSTDDFRCDLYVYESVGDFWVIHVASNRTVEDAPRTPPLRKDTIPEWMAARQVQSAFLDKAERRPIGLPHDGETFALATLEDTIAKVEYLIGLGYRVPDWVVPNMREELAEGTGE